MPLQTKASQKITIENATLSDLDTLHQIEELSFGGDKSASKEAFFYRLSNYPEWFFKAQSNGKTVGFINGCPSKQKYITDDLFQKGSDFDKDGENILIFGLAVHPDSRNKGIAHTLMETILRKAKQSGKKRVALTCKQSLIDFYKSFGYKKIGESKSKIANIKFFDMEISF